MAGHCTRSGQWAPDDIAGCIILPQAIVALSSPSVGRKAQQWGRRPLLLIGFAALAIRSVLVRNRHRSLCIGRRAILSTA